MFRKGSAIFLVKLVGTVMMLVANILMNRVVGFENFGNYVYLLGFANILVVFLCFGGDTYLKRELARSDNAAGKRDSSFFPEVRLVLRQTFLLWAPGIAITATFFWLTFSRATGFSYLIFALLCVIALFMALLKLCSGAFIGLSGALQEAFVTSVIKPGALVALLGLIVYFDIQTSGAEHALFIVHIAMLVIALCVAAFVLRNRFGLTIPRGVQKCNHTIGASFKILLPLALVSSAVILERNIDILMLGILDDTDSSALYYISTRISAFFLMPLFILNSISLPIISRSYVAGDKDKVVEKSRQVSIYSSVISAFALIFVAVFGKKIFSLFGTEYEFAYYPMLILCIGNVIRTFIGPVQMVGLMCNLEHVVSRANIYSLIINVILNSLLIPLIGIYGAIMATVVTRLGRSIFLSRILSKKHGMNVGLVTV